MRPPSKLGLAGLLVRAVHVCAVAVQATVCSPGGPTAAIIGPTARGTAFVFDREKSRKVRSKGRIAVGLSTVLKVFSRGDGQATR